MHFQAVPHTCGLFMWRYLITQEPPVEPFRSILCAPILGSSQGHTISLMPKIRSSHYSDVLLPARESQAPHSLQSCCDIPDPT